MAARNYLDFDVRIERAGERGEGRYRVRAGASQEGEAEHTFDWPFGVREVENLVLRVRPSGRRVRSFQSAEIEAAKELGGRLYEAVFAGDVRGRLAGIPIPGRSEEQLYPMQPYQSAPSPPLGHSPKHC